MPHTHSRLPLFLHRPCSSVPPNTVTKKNKIYYHVQDIKFLMNDPIIGNIRKYKTYRKQLRKYKNRHDTAKANGLRKTKPEFKFDHMVKERYPSFMDALKDLDDGLSMIFLFASLPQNKWLRHWVVDHCVKLANEWTSYIIRSRSLKKTFCSIKGIYFQASIMGTTCTWMVPYPYSPNVPENVDMKVMMTFLEFHLKHLEFVMYRLYAQLGLSYPPVFNAALASNGATVTAYQFKEINAVGKQQPQSSKVDDEDDEDDLARLNDDEAEIGTETEAKNIEAQVQVISDTLHEMGMDVDQFEDPGNEVEAQNELLDRGGDEFRELAALEGEADPVANMDPLPTLFRGLVFFVGRENLRDALYTALASCGATVGWDGVDSPFDATSDSITHMVCDRPVVADPRVDCEYVQPQWVFDSVNYAVLLPVEEYYPGRSLPPHLSPFVDDEAAGYVPERKKEILRFIEESKGNMMAPELGDKRELDEGIMDHVDAEEIYQEGLQVETGKLRKGDGNAEDRAKVRRREREEEAVRQTQEEKDLVAGTMTRKKRRLYERIQNTKQKKEVRANKLRERAEDFRSNMK